MAEEQDTPQENNPVPVPDKPRSSRLIGLAVVMALLVIGVAVALMCSTTPVPPGGVPVPAGAFAVTGNPPALGGGPIPAGAMCAGGTGDTSNAPGASCWVINTCQDTYHMTTGKCECRCM